MRSARAPSGTRPTLTLRVDGGDCKCTVTAIWDTSSAVTPLGRLRPTSFETSPVAPAIDMGCVFRSPLRSASASAWPRTATLGGFTSIDEMT